MIVDPGKPRKLSRPERVGAAESRATRETVDGKILQIDFAKRVVILTYFDVFLMFELRGCENLQVHAHAHSKSGVEENCIF